MAGYMQDYSMSNNAFDAYCDGLAPISKWTKQMLTQRIAELDPQGSLADRVKKLPLAFLRDTFLRCTEWHHTSSRYNRTDFYELSEYLVEGYVEEPASLDESFATWQAQQTKKKAAEGGKVIGKLQHGTLHYQEYISSGRHGRFINRKVENAWVRQEGNWLVAYNGRGKNAAVVTKRQIGGCASPYFEKTPISK